MLINVNDNRTHLKVWCFDFYLFETCSYWDFLHMLFVLSYMLFFAVCGPQEVQLLYWKLKRIQKKKKK